MNSSSTVQNSYKKGQLFWLDITLTWVSEVWSCSAFLYSLKYTPMLYLFVWFDSLRHINNLSVKQGRVFQGWTSTKLGYCVLLKDHNALTPVRLKPAAPWSRVKHSTTEPEHSLLTIYLVFLSLVYVKICIFKVIVFYSRQFQKGKCAYSLLFSGHLCLFLVSILFPLNETSALFFPWLERYNNTSTISSN